MIRERILIPSLLTLTALALGCKSNHEHGSHAVETHESEKAEAEEEGEAAEAHEGMELAQPATSLAAAIATAQKSVPDGRFLQAEIENEKGKTICSIVLASGDGVREVNVDAQSGAILATENVKLPEQFIKLLKEAGKDPTHPPIAAGRAIEAALAKVPGSWALAAALREDEGQVLYVVLLIDGKAAKVAHVSVADGVVQKISAMEEEEEGEEGMEESKEKEEAPPAKPK